MDVGLITEDAVRQALTCVRAARGLAGNSLLGTGLVSARLAATGLGESEAGRELALAAALSGAIEERLAAARARDGVTVSGHVDRTNGPVRKVPLSPAARRQLECDFLADDPYREAWSALYFRYLAMPPLQVKDVAAVVRGAAPHGRTHVARRISRGIELLTLHLRECEATLSGPDRTVILVNSAVDGALARLLEFLPAIVASGDSGVPDLSTELQVLTRHEPRTAAEHQAVRIAYCCRPRDRLDKRFVRLTLIVDHGEDSSSGRWQACRESFPDMMDVLASEAAPALVLLGNPGAGKTTVLRRLELDLAAAELSAGGPRLTFLVDLSRYRTDADGALPEPFAWLADKWRRENPLMPAFGEVLAAGHLSLLLDGLNEMPHASSAEYWRRVGHWKTFLADVSRAHDGNRIVFACRRLDYSAPLSGPELRVPQVQLEPLTDGQVRDFLVRQFGADGAAIWSELAASPHLALLRTPYYLLVLADQLDGRQQLSAGPAGLITGYLRRVLRREVERDNAVFRPDWLLTLRDRRRIVQATDWRSPYDLPEQGPLIPDFTALAYSLQRDDVGTDGARVWATVTEAERFIGLDHAEDLLQAGVDLDILHEDVDRDEVAFSHQLLQEYFAARRLADGADTSLVRLPWQAADMQPSIGDRLMELPAGETLPTAAQTGWEETTVLAVAMADDAESYVRALMTDNLPLAGRCANRPELRPRLSVGLLGDLRRALVTRSRDAAADLRARIAAALELGWLCDPRFEPRVGRDGAYLLPPLVEISGGVYSIGDDEPIAVDAWGVDTFHVPRHTVSLDPFTIGRFTVTNAEWACFMDAGGYEDPRWWQTDDAAAWQLGRGTADGQRSVAATALDHLRAYPEHLEVWLANGETGESAYRRWQQLLAMTPDEATALLAELFPETRLTEPLYWKQEPFGNPAQPVVGICWYEARAYCAWLSAQCGLSVRLPTEVEREAAARGRSGRRFAYGDSFALLSGNTRETRLRRPSPVGVFVEGDTPEGVSDLTGNVNDWTLSLWGKREAPAEVWRYPYVATPEREDIHAGPDVERVVRGGSWFYDQGHARCAYRVRSVPGYRCEYTGLRVVVQCEPSSERRL